MNTLIHLDDFSIRGRITARFIVFIPQMGYIILVIQHYVIIV